MSAKVSVSFGADPNFLSVEDAGEFFLGCTDAFKRMGLFKFKQLVDLIEVVRIYPNSGGMSSIEKQIIVEVVLSWAEKKRAVTFRVCLCEKPVIRQIVADEIVRTTTDIARNLLREFKEPVDNICDRLQTIDDHAKE
ncbi:MAG: hypothetical protein WC757_04730 [Candidatus Paceibacterota bacterium]|jgi:hypothetical protein